MYKILTLNNIAVAGLARFPRESYEVASEMQHPDAVLVRSFDMHRWDCPDTVKAIGRAGAGVNNIPVASFTQRGIPVFNTPGANANAVKELVLSGLFIAARNLLSAAAFTQQLTGTDQHINEQVEQLKKQFVGFELAGRTLGVIGLGAIGVKVANAAEALGMNVIGYDPHITVSNAWKLSANVKNVSSVEEVLRKSEFVSLHVPLVDGTRQLLNADRLEHAKTGLVLLNFSRQAIVDETAVCAALNKGKLSHYICDFPSNQLQQQKGVITFPHLGASTREAEENCAVMVADQIRQFLEQGLISYSVNFPDMDMPINESCACRLFVANANVPHMIERISSTVARDNVNIVDMLNRSRGDVACTLLDLATPLSEATLAVLKNTEGVLSARVLTPNY
ncbi:3-phosphoglycerate dehydrogenase family protein [Thioflexithrix psekupsensis]|uniref:D-3-phosphoglycerate dehydrogenase n=1 Tax=Thioflexithrix psekupsensis TaxID=1570016 RepID=A0A251X980_9GAMM|nr:3-phosphoglycerate dehydrogenase family protein [Thioflexithrix psekupsensis]OUD14566.1 3-phosphoglycerate dehydrogenase [Thioflexithrix psekupsensis]